MRFINKTPFSTKELYYIYRLALKKKKCKRKHRQRIKEVTIIASRLLQITGWVDLESGRLRILLPKGFRGGRGDVDQLAAILEHEIDHICHLKEHSDMEFNGHWWKLPCAWAGRLLLTPPHLVQRTESLAQTTMSPRRTGP